MQIFSQMFENVLTSHAQWGEAHIFITIVVLFIKL